MSNSSSSKLGAAILDCGDMSLKTSKEFDSGPWRLVWVIIFSKFSLHNHLSITEELITLSRNFPIVMLAEPTCLFLSVFNFHNLDHLKQCWMLLSPALPSLINCWMDGVSLCLETKLAPQLHSLNQFQFQLCSKFIIALLSWLGFQLLLAWKIKSNFSKMDGIGLEFMFEVYMFCSTEARLFYINIIRVNCKNKTLIRQEKNKSN